MKTVKTLVIVLVIVAIASVAIQFWLAKKAKDDQEEAAHLSDAVLSTIVEPTTAGADV